MSKTKITLNGKTILVTGSPGFIGANLVMRLLKEMSSGTVVSLDNMNDYYDPALKEYRLRLIEKAAENSKVEHVFVKGSIGNKVLIDRLFAEYHFDIVVNLAAILSSSNASPPFPPHPYTTDLARNISPFMNITKKRGTIFPRF